MARIAYGSTQAPAAPAPFVTPERSVRIFLNGELVAVSQGSPYGLAELAVGYLFSEGVVSDRDRLTDVVADEAAAEVRVVSGEHADVLVPLHRVTSAGCARSALLRQAGDAAAPMVAAGLGHGAPPVLPPLETSARLAADALLAGMEELCGCSPRRNAGECVHGCGLGDGRSPRLLLVREDIGRHNAMDKAVGQAWLERLPLHDKALFVTGRISCEMALKAHRAGCPVLVSCKSATDEAVSHAEALGVTLVSHCRDGFLRVLSHPDRIPG